MQKPGEANEDLLSAIREVNLSYLMIAQQLLRESLPRGIFRLGIDEETARVLLTLSPSQTVQIASTPHVICDFRLSDPRHLHALQLGVPTGTPATRATQSVYAAFHTTILLTEKAANEETVQN